MAATAASCGCSRAPLPAVSPLSSTRARGPVCYLSSNPNIFRPNLSFKYNFKITRLRISLTKRKEANHVRRVPFLSCLAGDNPEVFPESEFLSNSNDSPVEAGINIKLPRRSLMVQFTCNSCGARSERLVNRLAFERGTVFVQCSGCLQHHKLVDNLGLVIEYDLREDKSLELSVDQD